METITPQGLRDFLVCPLYFQYRHIDDDYAKHQRKDVYLERYLNVMRRVVSLYFYRKQADENVTFNTLVKRWEKLWFPEELDYQTIAYGEVVASNMPGMLIHYNSLAIAALERFVHLFGTDTGTPVVINEERVFQATPQLRVKTPLDLVLQYSDGSRKVVKWQVGPPRFGRQEQLFNIAATYLAMKSDDIYKPNTTFVIYDFHEYRAKMRRFELSESDIETFLWWAQQVTDRGSPIPRRGFTPYCNTCSFDAKCRDYVDEMISGKGQNDE